MLAYGEPIGYLYWLFYGMRDVVNKGLFYHQKAVEIRTWASYHINYLMWNVNTHPCPSAYGAHVNMSANGKLTVTYRLTLLPYKWDNLYIG